MFSPFCLANVLRPTAACHFRTSELTKSGPRVWCFPHFDLQMCFAPQPRGILEHRNFQNSSANRGVLCILTCKCASRHSARAIFATSERPKWLRDRGVLCILTCKCASRHSRVPFFSCPRNSYLRTRRFSEPTFRTSGTTIHCWENTAIRDFTNIFRACTFFLVTLHEGGSSFCWLDISTLLHTSTLLFNSAYCRKLDF